ncbi:hypothetical protein Taro_052917 [Colocasia esculenta]|uniref:MINDY deubiquitinase domain-containing protein n=1 Tax=Colocasia esculenta TaxID=4460 RepID=A0A843XJT2_COLES|nr:hypothetical protein [Colocasia esculenta]
MANKSIGIPHPPALLLYNDYMHKNHQSFRHGLTMDPGIAYKDKGRTRKLFSLQEGLKEREMCVFFRNNHFSTMFKYNGELLSSSHGPRLNQQDLIIREQASNDTDGDDLKIHLADD